MILLTLPSNKYIFTVKFINWVCTTSPIFKEGRMPRKLIPQFLIAFLFTILAVVFLALFAGCSPTEPEIRGDISYSDVVGTCWERVASTSTVTYVHERFWFEPGAIYCQMDKYSDQVNGLYQSRYFMGAINNAQYVVDYEGDGITLQFYWTRKEYVDGNWDRPVMDNSVASKWFLWKIENDTLYFGYMEGQDCKYWKFTQVE